ncbi:MAG: hypothetical protein IK092_03605 [Muribaculaceae bacterium]|nr:hypothetical protein [Muribaculaceae bacterium]
MRNDRITAESIAGYCYESAMWQMLCDVAQMMVNNRPVEVTPSSIIIDEGHFAADAQEEFSEADAVWSLGAVVSYMSSGHKVFGGKGKQYQESHPGVALPLLRREHEALTPLVHACLQADVEKRISLKQLVERAKAGLDDCLRRESVRIELPVVDDESGSHDALDAVWPEEMSGGDAH